MHEIPCVPFPDIPRYPPTADAPPDPKHDKGNRPIEWPWDSKLLEQAEALPYLTALGRHLTEFVRTENIPRQRQQCQAIWQELFEHPGDISQFFSTLSLLRDRAFINASQVETLHARAVDAGFGSDAQQQLDKQVRYQNTLARFEALMEEERERSFKHLHNPALDEDQAYTLLELTREGHPDKSLGDAILKKKFESVKTDQHIVNLLYSLCLAAIKSNNDTLLQKVFDIMYLQTPFVTPESPATELYTLANFSLNDETLKKQFEIEGMITLLGKDFITEVGRAAHHKLLDTIEKDDAFLDKVRAIQEKNPERYAQLTKYFGHAKEADGYLHVPKEQTEFPYNVLFKYGELRDLVHQRHVADSLTSAGTRIANVTLPGLRNSLLRIPENITDVFDYTRECYVRHLADTPHAPKITDGHEINCLGYLTPQELNPSQIKELAFTTAPLQEDFQCHRNHALLNPSGDRMLITHESLNKLGYRDILFQMNKKNKKETMIDITIGNYCFKMRLNEHYELQHREPNKSLVLNGRAKAWIEHLIFSHLHELLCTTRTEEIPHTTAEDRIVKIATGTTADGESVKRRARSRRAHKRDLAQGESYTPTQFNYVLAQYSINLAEWNRELGRTKTTGMRTFVSEYEEEVSDDAAPAEPIVSRAPHALDLLARVLEEKAPPPAV